MIIFIILDQILLFKIVLLMTVAKIIKINISNSKICSKNNQNYYLKKSKISYENLENYYLKQ